MQQFFNQFPLLVDEIRRYTKNKATVILQVGSDKQLNSLKETLEEYNLDLPLSSFGGYSAQRLLRCIIVVVVCLCFFFAIAQCRSYLLSDEFIEQTL